MQSTVNITIQIESQGNWTTLDTMNTDRAGCEAAFAYAARRLFEHAGATPVRIVIGPETPATDNFDAAQVVESLETNW